MGSPKLLLSLGEQTVIGRLLGVLNREEITDRVVVVRRDDQRLRQEVLRCAGTVVQPEFDPPDMRTSVQHALDEIRRRYAPIPDDGWLLVPADHPLLESSVLDAMLEQWRNSDVRILIPTFAGWRGHPAILRWSFADEVPTIPPDFGLNWLLEKHIEDVTELPVDDESILLDLDTPEDLEAARRRV